jgi:hypothetical protein
MSGVIRPGSQRAPGLPNALTLPLTATRLDGYDIEANAVAASALYRFEAPTRACSRAPTALVDDVRRTVCNLNRRKCAISIAVDTEHAASERSAGQPHG